MLNASEKEKLLGYEALQERLDKQFGGHVDIEMVLNTFMEYDAQIRDNKDLADALMLTNESALKYRRWKKLDQEGKLLELPYIIGDAVKAETPSGELLEGKVTGYAYSPTYGFCAIVSGEGGIYYIPFSKSDELSEPEESGKIMRDNDWISKNEVIQIIIELGYVNCHDRRDFEANCRVDRIRQRIVEMPAVFSEKRRIPVTSVMGGMHQGTES